MKPAASPAPRTARGTVLGGTVCGSTMFGGTVLGVAMLGATLGGVGCGGIAVIDDGVGGASTGAGTTLAATGVTKSATATGVTQSATAVQNTATTFTGGSPDIVPTLLQVKLFGFCQPTPPPDPVEGSVLVQYQNLGLGGGLVNIVTAQIGFSNPMEAWIFPITLAPQSSGFVGGGDTDVVEHVKVISQNSSFICGLCGQTGTVTLDFDNGTRAAQTFFFDCF